MLLRVKERESKDVSESYRALGECSESPRELFTRGKRNVNLHMCMKGSAHNCGTEFLSPGHCACAVREHGLRLFKTFST